MAVKNCPICSRIFEDLGIQDVCVSCFIENESDIRKVKDYLYLHPNNSIIEVSEATGVSIQKLKRFLQSERLIAVEKTSL